MGFLLVSPRQSLRGLMGVLYVYPVPSQPLEVPAHACRASRFIASFCLSDLPLGDVLRGVCASCRRPHVSHRVLPMRRMQCDVHRPGEVHGVQALRSAGQVGCRAATRTGSTGVLPFGEGRSLRGFCRSLFEDEIGVSGIASTAIAYADVCCARYAYDESGAHLKRQCPVGEMNYKNRTAGAPDGQDPEAQASTTTVEPAGTGRLLDLLLSPACRIDAQGKIIQLNDAWRAFAGPRVTAGTHWLDMLDAQEDRVAAASLLRQLPQGGAQRIECRLRGQSGELRWFLLNLQPLPRCVRGGILPLHCQRHPCAAPARAGTAAAREPAHQHARWQCGLHQADRAGWSSHPHEPGGMRGIGCFAGTIRHALGAVVPG